MQQITEFSSENIKEILEACRQALLPVAEKYGLGLDRRGRTYQQGTLPVMFELVTKGKAEDGTVLSTASAKDFVKHAKLFGLSPTDLGREFQAQGETYRISGLKPASRKYPILAVNVRTGKTYKFTVAAVGGV